jgi:hypothetical protein
MFLKPKVMGGSKTMRKNTVVSGPRSLVCLVTLGLLTGCGGESVDLGEDTDTEQQSSTLAGNWVATLSSAAFVNTGPKLLRLAIDAEGQGTLSVGAVTLDPPTDPNVGYPPEAHADGAQSSALLVHLYDGIAYDLRNVSANHQGVRFEVDAFQAFEGWCELQTPILTSAGYRCRQNWGGGVRRTDGQKHCFLTNPVTNENQEEDCVAISLCVLDAPRGCHCTEAECSVNDGGRRAAVAFDLALDEAGDTLRGGHVFTNGGAAYSEEIVEFTRE